MRAIVVKKRFSLDWYSRLKI
ncbi:hypothetical protein F383_33069 [Gossypium arboreum]|uniref:Uncharacterized protein n=1 Tax=Gossypium arboreum TaxID=29729 RepID=A0A0B0PP98_GOSAR|nr:hypothetical protein F383_01292 [Gossypium arboreum]KHG26702.1 hypothetical protein F383_33069 [Gossypium arboreum]